MQWYRDRGLTQKQTKIADKDTMFYNTGDVYTTEDITTNYSCGRIDIRGIPDEPYGDELGVPPMLSTDWRALGDWLWDVQTVSVWTLPDLITAYEQNNPKITWDTYEH